MKLQTPLRLEAESRLEYLKSINGLLNLTPRELKILDVIITVILTTPIMYEEGNIVYSKSISLIHYDKIMEKTNMNKQVLANYLSKLRKKSIIKKDNTLLEYLYPDKDNEYTLTVIYYE